MKTVVYNVIDRLPHDPRRLAFSLLGVEKIRRLKELRKSTDESGYSLASFDKHKCIFVHIPKAAGVSVSRSLFGNLGGGHNKIRDYQLVYSKSEFESYFKFSFVRNPWDRAYSAFKFLKNGGMNDDDLVWADKHLRNYSDFNAFICDWICEENINKGIHFQRQLDFLLDSRNRIAVDYIGRFEQLDTDVSRITSRLGISEYSLLHRNRTAGITPAYQDVYNLDSRKVIEKVYKNDIEFLGYDFNNQTLSNLIT